MSLQTWQELLASAQADSTALASSTTATSILHPTGKATLAANFFSIGKVLKLTAAGRISTTTGPPTITFDVRFNSTVVFSPAAVTTTASKTNVGWWLEILLTCRAVGSSTSANVMGQARLSSEAVTGSSAGLMSTISLPATSPVVGNGFDSTAAITVDLFGTWSASSASNSIQTHQSLLQSLN